MIIRKTLYLQTMGKLVRITHIALTDDEANDICEKDNSQSVIATIGNLVLLANKNDKGITAI